MRNYIVGLTLITLAVCSSGLTAQNVYKDYNRDEYAQYSALDHQQRGLLYKIHTGHAGIFGDCDDDRQKMISPYIDWHCRKPDCFLGMRFVKEIMSDMFRKNQRLTDGAGACVYGFCEKCKGATGECQCDHQLATHQKPARYAHRSDSQRGTGLTPAITLPASRTVQPIERQLRSEKSANPERSFDATDYFRTATKDTYQSRAYSANQSTRPSAPSTPPRLAPQSSQSLYSSVDTYRPLDERFKRNTNQRSVYQPNSSRNERATPTQYQRQDSNLPSRALSDSRSVLSVKYREQKSDKRPVPANSFERFEKTTSPQRPTKSQSSSNFRLSAGGVYTRPNFNPKTTSPEPAQDQKSDPRYFQFQRIGGSTYR